MQPTLSPGEKIMVCKQRFCGIGISDIVVVKINRGNDQVFYVKRIVKINKDNVYIMGDNKQKSYDSRQMGWIKKKDIIGKMIYKL